MVCLIDIFLGNGICISVLSTEEQRFIGGCLISVFKFRIFKFVVYIYYYIYLYLVFIYLLCSRNAVSIHLIMDLSLQMRLDGVLLHLTLKVSWGWTCPKFLILLFMRPHLLYIYFVLGVWNILKQSQYLGAGFPVLFRVTCMKAWLYLWPLLFLLVTYLVPKTWEISLENTKNTYYTRSTVSRWKIQTKIIVTLHSWFLLYASSLVYHYFLKGERSISGCKYFYPPFSSFFMIKIAIDILLCFTLVKLIICFVHNLICHAFLFCHCTGWNL